MENINNKVHFISIHHGEERNMMENVFCCMVNSYAPTVTSLLVALFLLLAADVASAPFPYPYIIKTHLSSVRIHLPIILFIVINRQVDGGGDDDDDDGNDDNNNNY